jgi:ubiquinone/menaquinone biosynthesis C-methylase UbiE
MSSSYQNLFDQQSIDYSRFRPHYPEELFDFLAAEVSEHKLAWDAGTGSGQAALQLAERFEQVIATDSSTAQISEAPTHKRISFRAATAEKSGLQDCCCDLITVASAVHWFDREVFYEEAKRILKPGAVIAVWCYSLITAPDNLAQAIERFYAAIEPFWPAPILLVMNRYRDLEFPFEEIDAPQFAIRDKWQIKQLLGFYSTWSAVQQFRTGQGEDPVERLAEELAKLTALDDAIEINLPLHLRVGRLKS